MLLANMSVAEKLYRAFPEIAVLRMHPPPQPRSLEATMKMLRAYGEKKISRSFEGVDFVVGVFSFQRSTESSRDYNLWAAVVA